MILDGLVGFILGGFFGFYGGSGVLVGGKVSMAEMGEIRAYRGTPYYSQKNIKYRQFVQ